MASLQFLSWIPESLWIKISHVFRGTITKNKSANYAWSELNYVTVEVHRVQWLTQCLMSQGAERNNKALTALLLIDPEVAPFGLC